VLFRGFLEKLERAPEEIYGKHVPGVARERVLGQGPGLARFVVLPGVPAGDEDVAQAGEQGDVLLEQEGIALAVAFIGSKCFGQQGQEPGLQVGAEERFGTQGVGDNSRVFNTELPVYHAHAPFRGWGRMELGQG